MNEPSTPFVPKTALWRPLSLLLGYLCMASLGFIGFRVGLVVFMSVLVVASVLMFLAHGGFRTAPLSGREHLVCIGGYILIVSVIWIPGVHPAFYSDLGFPIQPIFIWIALFHGVRDFRLWRVYGLPLPLHVTEKVPNGENTR